MKQRVSIVLMVLVCCVLMIACEMSGELRNPPVMGDRIEASDYSRKEHWLHLPDTNHAVDVFYLYPTALVRNEGEPLACEMNNKSMIAGSNRIYKAQATVFESVGNIYAPYYRQIDAVWALE